MSGAPDIEPRRIAWLFCIAALALLPLTIVWASTLQTIDESLMPSRIVVAVTIAMLLLSIPLHYIPRVCDQRNFLPRWYLIVFTIRLAALAAALALLALALASSFFDWSIRELMWKSFMLLLIAFGLAGVWSSFAVNVQRLLRQTTPGPPPAAH